MPIDKIYSRLGYAKGLTQINEKQRQQVDVYIEEALDIIKSKGSARGLKIKSINKNRINLDGGKKLISQSLADLLSDSGAILFIAATVGSKIIEAIDENSSRQDMTKAVVFDAVASEGADEALNWIMNYYRRQLSRQNSSLEKRRFSAGYGDFGLENQKIIYDLLGLKRLGVKLTKQYILIPEKSVTALCGIKNN